jgi:hypothetical protein
MSAEQLEATIWGTEGFAFTEVLTDANGVQTYGPATKGGAATESSVEFDDGDDDPLRDGAKRLVESRGGEADATLKLSVAALPVERVAKMYGYLYTMTPEGPKVTRKQNSIRPFYRVNVLSCRTQTGVLETVYAKVQAKGQLNLSTPNAAYLEATELEFSLFTDTAGGWIEDTYRTVPVTIEQLVTELNAA